MAGPWLTQSPRGLLAEHNASQTAQQQLRQGVTPYGVLTIRVFIFYEADLLLKREADTWTVPTLQYTASDNDNTAHGIGKAIFCRIIADLDKTNTPESLLHELQFTDLRLASPSIAFRPSNQPNIPSKIIIDTVLTTSYQAHRQNVAPRDDLTVPEATTFRWVDPDNMHTINLSTNLTTKSINQAKYRHASCTGAPFLDNLRRYPGLLPQIINITLASILQTRAILKGHDSIGFGLILVDGVRGRANVAFTGASRDVYAQTPMLMTRKYGNGEAVVVGKWCPERVEGVEAFGGWVEVFDWFGRVRENMGRDRV
ncbi:hypothetical protein M409DRAFT_23096 [Zasmidium cellare ATCC 36951]|uniref:Uncharacterized protein n=1 Tax=Zasmidium cellare ATCC 36951 TaxID=1080233 RepID=A0A6A6CLY9_ZASCE|nr:uncharacterized protein M409DRAFT_23096 [Zasmidium cellare ATCC 36951]KAF2166456.1 hypothetical protein M409DRAFT_23096 [Zasmidium cellare ATCC 36951]